MRTWIPRTKLYPPDTSRVVIRKHLLDELQIAVSLYKLTLISAPAGSGKTTLVSHLAHMQLSTPTAWISLDETDNDPSMFIAALTACFRTIDENYGAAAESLIDSGMSIDLKRLIATLINDTLNTPPFLLVFDDLHVISEQSVLQAIDFLLERLPPSIRVLISTRHDPPLSLARLRAQSQLHEVRLEALRFGIQETTLLMNEQLELRLTENDLNTISERTDGWIAGLRLIGLSLLQLESPSRSSRIAHLIGNNRYIFDLLADEILKQQEDAVQDFLLQTCLLDELSPELCDKVVNRSDSRRILKRMYQHNLFLRLVDASTDTYRYHDLFADFLRYQLQTEYPDLVKPLHLRAAAAEPLPTRKILHYIAAEAWEEAVQFITEVGEKMVETGNRLTVQRWITLLPESVRSGSGWILYLQGTLAYHRGDLEASLHLFEQAEIRFREVGDNEGVSKALVMHYASSPDSAYIQGLERLMRSLEPFNLSPSHQLNIQLAHAWVYLYDGNRIEAARYFLEAFRLAQKYPELPGLLGIHIAAPILIVFDEVEILQVHLRALLTLLEEKMNLLKPVICSMMAQIALWQGDLLTAKAFIRDSRQHWEQLGGIPHDHQGVVAWQEVIIAILMGDKRQIETILPAVDGDFNDITHLATLRGRREILKGNFKAAQRIIDRMPLFYEPETSISTPIYLASIQALLDLNKGGIEGVENNLLPYISGQRQRNFFSLFVIDLRVILAYCYFRYGLQDEALKTFEPMLRECERMNMPGRIAQEGEFAVPLLELAIQKNTCKDFARRALDLLHLKPPEVSSVKIEETGEVLSPREVEVLRLLANGATNRDIADAFVISIPTVKTHVSRILQKLNVATRTQAAAKARNLLL